MTSYYARRLSAALHEKGQTVVLRRTVGQMPNIMNVDVTLPAAVRSPTAEELASGIGQSDSIVVISPLDIQRQQWPGGELPSPTTPDPSLPRRNDKIVINGRVRNIEHVGPITVGDELARITLRVLG